MSDLSFAASAAAAIAGAGIDLRTGRIPNALTAATAATGFALAATGTTGTSPLAAAVGGALGLALMMPGHIAGGIAGGVLAIGHAWRRGRMGATVARTARLAAGAAG